MPHLLSDAMWEPLKQQGQEGNEVKSKHQAKLAQLTLNVPSLTLSRKDAADLSERKREL